jgi:hypothetical protein
MLHQNKEMKKEPFIPSELRPQLWTYIEKYPPLLPDASKEEMQKLACEVIGNTKMKQLGLTQIWFSSEMWKVSIARSPDVIWTVISDGESVLLHLDRGTYHSLNRTSTFVWELLTGSNSLEEILSTLCNQFDVSEDVACEDLTHFIAMLRLKGLVVDHSENQKVLIPENSENAEEKVSPADASDTKEAYQEMTLLEHGALVEITNKSGKDGKDGKDGLDKKDAKDGSDKFFF